MALYEHVFLARQDASTQQVEELTAQMTGIVEGLGGKVTKTENWGVRSLTYRMNKNRKAHFVLLNIDAPSAAIAEIERQERISEDVIRYLSVRVEELEEGPSAMMRKADRDRERDDRGGGSRDREGGGSVATAKAVSVAAIVTVVASAVIAARAVRATTLKPPRRMGSKNNG